MLGHEYDAIISVVDSAMWWHLLMGIKKALCKVSVTFSREKKKVGKPSEMISLKWKLWCTGCFVIKEPRKVYYQGFYSGLFKGNKLLIFCRFKHWLRFYLQQKYIRIAKKLAQKPRISVDFAI